MPQHSLKNPHRVCALLCAAILGSTPLARTATPTDQRPELALQLGHSLLVRSLAYSPDGSTLASAAEDGTIKLWDAQTHDLVRTLAGHSGPVYSVAFARDGRRLVSGSKDGTAKIWSARTGQILRTMRVPDPVVFSVAFSPDGKTIATGSGDLFARALRDGKTILPRGRLVLWDAATGGLKRTVTSQIYQVYAVAFSPDGSTLASAGRDNTARLWDAHTGARRQTLAAHTNAITSLAIAPDGTTLATGSRDRTVRLWDGGTGKLLHTLTGHSDSVNAVAFNSDGKTIASGSSDFTAKLWDTGTGELKQTLAVRSHAYSVAFAPDGSTLASGSASAVQLWDVQMGRVTAALGARQRWVESLDFAPDGKTIASSSGEENRVLLWDAATGALKRTLSGSRGRIITVAFAPNSRLLASGGSGTDDQNEISLWDGQTGRLVRRLPGHKGIVYSLAFSPDGKILASGSSMVQPNRKLEEIKLWDVPSGKLLRAWTGRAGWISSLAFAPDGKTLAGGSALHSKGAPKGDLQLWDARTGKLLRRVSPPQDWVTSIAFSPDGSTLASGSRDKTVRLWDARTGKLLRSLAGHTDWVKSVKFAPDGKTLASGSKDKTIRLWDVRSGKISRVLLGHDFGVWAVDFSPDGRRLASGSTDTSLRLWDVSNGRELAKLLTAPADDPEMRGPAWLAVTPEGYYHCSEGADYLFKWRFRDRLVPFYRFEETYRRPDILRQALRRERIAARPLTLARVPPSCWILSPEPDADITSDSVRVLIGVTDDEAAPIDARMYVNGVLVPETIAKAITADAKPIISDGKDIFAYARAAAAEANVANVRPITAMGKPIAAEGKPITADGKEVPPEHRFSRIVTMDVVLPPGEKDLTLRAVIYDTEKNKYDAAVTVRRTHAKPIPRDLYVLCVGVSEYRNPNYNLNFAAADANAIAAVLRLQQGGEYTNVHTIVLTDRQATAKGIRAALQDLQKKARSLDTVMVFLSGHGLQIGGKSYFAPWGTFINDIPGTCLPWSEMMQMLSNVYAKKLLFTDACHSGSKLGAWQATSEQLTEAARRRTGIVMLSSSRGNEFSFEERPLQHGAFTVALIEAFNGKADVDGNSIITLPELALYVPQRVKALTRGLQNPHLVLVQDFNPQDALARVPAVRSAERD